MIARNTVVPHTATHAPQYFRFSRARTVRKLTRGQIKRHRVYRKNNPLTTPVNPLADPARLMVSGKVTRWRIVVDFETTRPTLNGYGGAKIAAMQVDRIKTATGTASTPVWLTIWKDGAAATASTLTAISLIVAAAWTYLLFVKKRQRFPRANVEHRVLDWAIDNHRLVRAVIRVTNVGEVIVRVAAVRAAVTQIVPVPSSVSTALAQHRDPVDHDGSEIVWDTLADRRRDFSSEGCEIEPSETEEFIFDFVLASTVIKFQVYSHIQNLKKWKKNIGWNTTSIHDVGKGERHGDNQENLIPNGTGETEAH